MSNGLYRYSFTTCTVCHKQSPWVDESPEYAQRELRKLGWRPERAATEYQWGRTHNTVWYCPEHEQLRPSLKKNQKGA